MTPREFFDELNKHEHIAWDIDGTLLEADHAKHLFAWVAANQQKKHYLVTFRNGHLLDSLEDEIENERAGGRALFQRLHTMPEHIKWDKETEEIRTYKPNVCAENGYTVLIDDLTFLKEECENFGIVYLNPADSLSKSFITEW